MPIFKIEIVETLNKIVAVRAKDEAEALELVEEEYSNSDIILDGGDMTAPAEFNVLGDESPTASHFINC